MNRWNFTKKHFLLTTLGVLFFVSLEAFFLPVNSAGLLSICPNGTLNCSPSEKVFLKYRRRKLEVLLDKEESNRIGQINDAEKFIKSIFNAINSLAKKGSAFEFSVKDDIGRDIQVGNISTLNSLPPNESLVIIDRDGQITDLFAGAGSSFSVLGLAGPTFTAPTANPRLQEIIGSQAIINASLANSSGVAEPRKLYTAVLRHEFLHMIGIDHNFYDGAEFENFRNGVFPFNLSNLPLMFPISIGQTSFRIDDVAALVGAYPRRENDFVDKRFGKLVVKLSFNGDKSAFAGHVLVARKVSNPKDVVTAPIDRNGRAAFSAVKRGARFFEIEALLPDLSGGSSVGVENPPSTFNPSKVGTFVGQNQGLLNLRGFPNEEKIDMIDDSAIVRINPGETTRLIMKIKS